MAAGWISGRAALLGAVIAFSVPLAVQTAEAARHPTYASSASYNASAIQAGMHHARTYRGYGATRSSYYGGGLQCVPFARENSGIELSGNAGTWWNNADGVYERGARPEVGSVLNFRANGRMRMGHVAVVSRVVDSRNVEIDHANWSGRGAITRNVSIVDVSERNDWTAVRVALGRGEDFGSVYPTYGFIYDRPDRGTLVANSGSAPLPQLNAAPRDLRPSSERYAASAGVEEELAEAADDAPVRSRRASGWVSGRGFAHGSARASGRVSEQSRYVQRGGAVLSRGTANYTRAVLAERSAARGPGIHATVIKVRSGGHAVATPTRGRHRL